MSNNSYTPTKEFIPVINSEGQYSIWPAVKELPPGWIAAGKHGTREECLEYIAQTWTDMTPISLREKTVISNEIITDILKV